MLKEGSEIKNIKKEELEPTYFYVLDILCSHRSGTGVHVSNFSFDIPQQNILTKSKYDCKKDKK